MNDIYLKLSGLDINGESSDKDHRNWIEFIGFEHKIFHPHSISPSSFGGRSVGRAEHGDLTLVKGIELSSPLLYQAVSGGTTFDSAQIECFRAAGDGSRVKYLEIQLKHAMISRVEAGIDDVMLPVETISLHYGAIQWRYVKQDIDGRPRGVTVGAWSLVRNDKSFSV